MWVRPSLGTSKAKTAKGKINTYFNCTSQLLQKNNQTRIAVSDCKTLLSTGMSNAS